MIASVFILCTPYGDREPPADLKSLYEAAPKRRDRQPDRRTRAGKAYAKREAEALAEAEAEYMNA